LSLEPEPSSSLDNPAAAESLCASHLRSLRGAPAPTDRVQPSGPARAECWRKDEAVITPDIITPFLLTIGVSFLIGIGLREYYESEAKFETFGTVRTFIFIGMLGFVLYRLPAIGNESFLAGFAALSLFLLVYYGHKVLQRKSPGMIGVLMAMLTYVTGPIALQFPQWYLVLIAITVLIVLHSKGRIRRFTDRLQTGEVVTACKFLAIVAVVLPLIPETPPTEGPIWRFFAMLPVTPRQIWLAVVITTAISYLGYVLQTYLFPRKGLVLAGLVGGLYSSTATVLVLSKKSKASPAIVRRAAMAILLAVSMLYLRLLVLVVIFRPSSLLLVAPALLAFSSGAALYSLWLRRKGKAGETPGAVATSGDVAGDPALRKNPLELNAAFLFAVLFVVVSLATKYVIAYFQIAGLHLMSFVVGFSDITPFVVSLLQSNFGIGNAQVVQAMIIAAASNNLLQVAYAYAFGNRRTATLVAPGMVGLAAVSMLYALFGL
jgi:uncharacterized membrane protein (DUF4010 family)